MPPPSCAVAECGKGGRKRDSDTILHKFPTKNSNICKVWATKCKRDQLNISTARICSNHFLDSDYERDLEHELLGLPVRKRFRLKPTAIPSIFEERKELENAVVTSRQQRMNKRKQLTDVNEAIGKVFIIRFSNKICALVVLLYHDL